MLFHIVAVAKNGVIGKDNKLPWHFPADLKHFKELTLGSTVLMGRKTYESIGKPLPGRQNFVLSRTLKIGGVENLFFFRSMEEALPQIKTPNAFIIGGAAFYKHTFHLVDGIYLTRIEEDYEGDAFYPKVPGSFVEESRTLLQEEPRLECVFYRRKF